MICVRLQPWVTPQPRLKCNGIAALRQSRFLHKSRNRFITLRAVTSGMRRTRILAAVFLAQTMATRRIGFVDLPLRHSVKTKQEMIEAVSQEIFGTRHQRIDV